MKIKNRFLALTLTGIMLLSTAACGKQEASETSKSGSTSAAVSQAAAESTAASQEAPVNELEWLNTDGGFPIVKEGTEKTLSIYCKVSPDNGEPTESWLYEYLTENMNINLEFTTFTEENKDEFLSLAFAGDDLPDIIIGGGFSTLDLLKYGAEEGQLLELSPYINETYMPTLAALLEENPTFKDPLTDNDGNVWSLGYIANPANRSYVMRAFYNYDWLEECNLEVPTTLDEFVEAMRTFKEKGLCEYPIGGAHASTSPVNFLLNAFGYIGSGYMDIALRNGEVVLPAADRETFGDFITFMNQLYTEGLIHPDYYTMDKNSMAAHVSNNVGFIAQAPFVYIETFDQYWGASPLTSDWNDTAKGPVSNSSIKCGAAVITSHCEEPELAAKFLDYFYGDGYRIAVGATDSEGKIIADEEWGHWTVDEEGEDVFLWTIYEENKEQYANLNQFLAKHIIIWDSGLMGCDTWNFNYDSPAYKVDENWKGKYEDVSDYRKDAVSGQNAFTAALENTMVPYNTYDVYPGTVYFDVETSQELNNTKTLLKEYADQEIAKFVTGSRPLDELDSYFDEMDRLGAADYVQAHKEYYEAAK